MAARQLILPANRAFGSNGLAVPFAVASLYETGTTTPVAFYSDDTLATSLGTSLTANGAGRFSNSYQDSAIAFRLIITDPDGVELDDIDPFYFGAAYFDGTVTEPGADQPLTQVINGLQIIWTGGLGFSMSAGSYYIDGNIYTAEAQTITLDDADATHPRIDVLAVDTSGDFVRVEGTPGANPSEPDVDPVTQLKLKFVLVPAGETEPDIPADEIIYEEADGSGEWTPTTAGSAYTTNSSSEPDSGTVCIAGTSVTQASSVTLNKGSTLSRDSYDALILRVKSKTSAWGTGRLRVHFQNANSVRVGNIASIQQGSFGFVESNTSSYQQVVIPLASLAIPAGTLIQKLFISSAGGAFSCRIDNIKLQASSTAIGGGGGSGISQSEADARYAQRANNLSDLASAATALVNLGIANLGTALPLTFNYSSDGEARFYADAAMTLTQQATSGTGSVAYEKSTAAAPTVFSSTSSPITLEAGAWLKVTASSVTAIYAVHLKRTA